ncbi:hypothetical protein THAOC_22010 [Thalassiosira oceanica]|uniref:Uncharacterized protein n=1 Tax=Thalassiosira oceanica TaxID=159749 RepID=K0SAB7_THAOC|nr:hypothetical protein THAOC_22010 [Thalassiosira oceanica]|eukprot:EJK57906.1 hypothetical protein THAOC_22010 [Thalassiosira oceanica]
MHTVDVHAEPLAVSGGRRKAELSSLQGLLSTSTTRAVRAETVGLATRLLHDARAYGRSEDHGWNKRNHRNRAVPLAPASPYSFGVALRSKDI